MVTKIITRIRRISSVKRSSAAEDSNRGDDEDNNKRNNTQGDNSNDNDKHYPNEEEENQLAKKLKGCQNNAADGGVFDGHSYHDVFFRCKPNDDTTTNDEKAADVCRKTNSSCTKKKNRIDLTGVPPQLPIKSSRNGTSMYQGVYLHKATKKWRAQIRIDGKKHTIGYYDTDREAAVDYARAVFKYEAGKVNAPRKRGQQKFIDLSDVPAQPPILKSIGMGATSKYRGVYFHKATNKWRARIEIDGKEHHIGLYDNEEQAAVDYARAVFKYNKS